MIDTKDKPKGVYKTQHRRIERKCTAGVLYIEGWMKEFRKPHGLWRRKAVHDMIALEERELKMNEFHKLCLPCACMPLMGRLVNLT